MRRILFIVVLTGVVCAMGLTRQEKAADPPFRLREVMIPMRDGVHLQTAILTPVRQQGPLPILFRRTPYGVPEAPPASVPPSWVELAQDGYIFVIQNLRGRFKSEGRFELTSQVNLSNPKSTNEATDAYDSIEWLVKNVPNNNGRVGMYGVSYDGLTAALALLEPHPALKAMSEQASPADEWMNDDDHHYGALRESYDFEYAVMEQADKTQNTHFVFETYDTYEWYLNLGPLANINAKYLHGSIPYWNSTVEHPDYDAFWKKEAWVRQLHGSTVPNLNVAGFFDQEDPWGPWQIFRHAAEHDPEHTNLMVAGPWFHGQWQRPQAESIGIIPFGGHDTAREFRENIEAPFFRYYLHGQGEKPAWSVTTFQSGSNTWHSYAAWPPAGVRATMLYLHSDGTLSFTAPTGEKGAATYREYVSDPANPVPYRARPISPTYPGGDWRTWEVADQRFVDHRPDVLTYESAPLEQDLTVTGPVSATVFASTSGTDSDFVVKLIDVFPQDAQKNDWDPNEGPEPGQYAKSLDGYEWPIAMEVRRGRYLTSFEHAQALTPNLPTKWPVPLRDRDHVFLKGHRIMVQIQSTWFPIIDRNPQKFVPSIYAAKADDFVKATQRVYASPEYPSHITLPVVPR
ncbi:MAG TPA: CocE/NonD family hydrolase [Candidatus Acidoferrales bacterium]|nr:CocE/NonD family hydrolase [Candidatus Acidoferrales bacterium]